ncbi:MAG: hypothetical protein ACTHJ0_02075 [Flavipsychrobacter sp.]
MKPIYFLLAIVFAAILFSCKKTGVPYQSNGVITGEDDAMCAFCGGYFIDINAKTYRFFSLPANSDIVLKNGAYPINVLVNWHTDTTNRIPNAIAIDAIARIK